ncbi:MAG: DegT/DnrJ/EryC1/StrS family aminotransferase [Acidobacteriota bacterium]
MIPHSRPWLTAADAAAVEHQLRSESLADGRAARAFAERMGDWVAASYALATASGAAALGLALEVLSIGHGDEVVVPTYACHRLADAIVRRGARPVPCDVGPHWVATADTIAPAVTPRTRAVVVPHIYGIFADVAACHRFGVPVIEDCAQAIGARRQPRLAGTVGIFSFHATKCLTTGQGGIVATRDAALARRLRACEQRGIEAPLGDPAAALGLAQLDRYGRALAIRARYAEHYRGAIAPVAPEWLAHQQPDRSMHYRFPMTVPGGIGWAGPRFARAGVAVRRGVDRLIHRELGLGDAAFPMATALFERTVCLPLYPALTPEDAARVAAAAADAARAGLEEAA